MKILLLCGPPRCGKDTIGGMLQTLLPGLPMLMKFAQPIIEFMLRNYGINMALVEKDVPHPRLHGRTPRQVAIAYSERFCKPLFGIDYFGREALSEITINGWNVGDHNPWMGQFLAQAKEKGLRAAFLTKKQGQNGVFVTAAMQETASLVNTLLIHFNNVGIVSQQSLTNWHRPGGGLVAGELVRTVLNSKQEGLPALRLEITEKDQGCVFAAGFNTGDKRWETLPCGSGSAPSAGPSQGSKTPSPTHAPTPGHKTPSPSPTPTPKACPPSMPHGTWPVCKDDPSKQPGPGKAPNGAGKNADPGPGVPNPSPTFPSAPHTNPTTPEPSKVPRPDPVPPAATGAPAPSNPGTTASPGTCIAAPGRPCM